MLVIWYGATLELLQQRLLKVGHLFQLRVINWLNQPGQLDRCQLFIKSQSCGELFSHNHAVWFESLERSC